MPTVGVIAHFKARSGNEQRMEQFFQEGVAIVQTQPSTTKWYAFRINSTDYRAVAVFATEADREALLTAGGPKLSKANADLFIEPPTFEKVDILAARE